MHVKAHRAWILAAAAAGLLFIVQARPAGTRRAETAGAGAGIRPYAAGTETRDRTEPGDPGADGRAYNPFVPAGPNGGPSDYPAAVRASNERGVRILFTLPTYEIRPVEGGMSGVAAPGLLSVRRAGEPELPVWSCLVAVPPGADPRIVIHSDRSEIKPDVAMVVPADRAILRRSGFLPASAVTLAGRGIMRDLDVVRVEVHPFQHDAANRALKVHSSLDFSVLFGSGDKAPLPAPGNGEARAAGGGILNQEWAESFRVRRASPPTIGESSARGVPAGVTEAYKVEVHEDGIYGITRTDLIAAGVTGIDAKAPRFFRIYHEGQEVAIAVDGERDNRFDDGDRILFFGEKNTERWTDTNVYWLVLNDIGLGPGRRMTRVDFKPASLQGFVTVSRRLVPIHLEEQGVFWVVDPNHATGDSWYYEDKLYTCQYCSPADWTHDIAFDVTRRAPSMPGENCRLKGRVASWTVATDIDPHNVIRLYVNDQQVGGDIAWDLPKENAPTEKVFDVTFPASLLQEGANTLKVEQPPTSSTKQRFVYMDYFDVEHPDVLAAVQDRADFPGSRTGKALYSVGGFSTATLDAFRVVDASAPERIEFFYTAALGPGLPVTALLPVEQSLGEAERFIVEARGAELTPDRIFLDTPSSLMDAGNGADYVIITPADFMTGAQQLADYRTTQNPNLQAMVVDVQDAYDEFSAGNASAQGIKDFLEWAFYNWSPAPTFVLLLGDSSYDYKNYLGYTGPGYERTYYVPSMEYYLRNPLFRRAASDAAYVEIAGDDVFSDMLIGRLPVRSEAQVQSVIDKIMQHESHDGTEAWNGRYLLLADDDIGNKGKDCVPPGITDRRFETMIVTPYLAALPPDDIRRVYADEYLDIAGVRTELFDNLNQGVGVMAYFGHGAKTLIGRHCSNLAAGVFLEVADLPRFTNNGHCPLGVAYSCNMADFDWASWLYNGPDFAWECLAESEVIAPQKAFVAWIGSTVEGADDTGDLGFLQVEGVFRALFTSQNLPPYLADMPPYLQANRTAGALCFAAQSRMYELVGEGDPASDPPGRGGSVDAVRILLLLGDPALQLRLRTQ